MSHKKVKILNLNFEFFLFDSKGLADMINNWNTLNTWCWLKHVLSSLKGDAALWAVFCQIGQWQLTHSVGRVEIDTPVSRPGANEVTSLAENL